MNFNNIIKSFTTDFFDFFLPRFCPACKNKLTNTDDVICSTCFKSIELAGQSRIDFEYDKKFSSKKLVTGFTSLFVFEKDKELQEILHQLKYNKRFRIGYKLGRETALRRKDTFKSWNIDLITSVPLHHLKKAERGYNQSYYIARGLSGALKIKLIENLLKRTRYTESQTSKNIFERELNVNNAFLVRKKKLVKDKKILLVDDVITTGATISECARQLLHCGAKKVYAASVAIAD